MTRTLFLALAAAFAIGAIAAQAQPRRDERRDFHRDYHHDWHGHPVYGAPPVVYGSPYYAPPPVVYGPGIAINTPGISVNIR